MQIIGHPGGLESAQSLGDSADQSLRISLEKHHLLASTAVVSFRKGLLGELPSPKTAVLWGRKTMGQGKTWEFSPRIHHPSSASLPSESAERVPAAMLCSCLGVLAVPHLHWRRVRPKPLP